MWVKTLLMMDLFQLKSSQDVNWWTGVVWIIVWTLILTAPIHIHWWAADGMLHFSKSDKETNSSTSRLFTQVLFSRSRSHEFSESILPVHPSDVLDMPVDPNEPTYCLCHQVSYGEMIGCDNPDVRRDALNSLLAFPRCIYLTKMLLLTVSHWVVSLRLRWSDHQTQREMVRRRSVHEKAEISRFPTSQNNVSFLSYRFCPRCTQDRKKKWDAPL